MRKILILLSVLLIGCTSSKKVDNYNEEVIEDTLYKVRCLDLLPPIDTLKKWESYPDSIITAFTRDGVVEDSVVAYRKGGLVDSMGNYYSPAYIFKAAVGDMWIYDINGKFIYFYETPLPHSEKGNKYNP